MGYTVHPPICHIFTTKKSGDKSGFGDKSGCDKSENAQYWVIWVIGTMGCFSIQQKIISLPAAAVATIIDGSSFISISNFVSIETLK